MLRIVLRKMVHNGWIVFCLLAGLILATAVISSIPMYTDGILQRMLNTELRDYQASSRTYPGYFSIDTNFYNPEELAASMEFYHYLKGEVDQNLLARLGVPVVMKTQWLTLAYLEYAQEGQRDAIEELQYCRIEALSDIESHIEILHGRMFSTEKRDGMYEVIITEQAMMEMGLLLDQVYVVDDMKSELEVLKLKVVGVFTYKDPQDIYWFTSLNVFRESFLMDFALLTDDFVDPGFPNFTYARWRCALDHEAITLEILPRLLSVFKSYMDLSETQQARKYRVDLEFPILPILETYDDRDTPLMVTLWFLESPMFLMLTFFIYMVSQLIIESEKNEIAVLKSRGARRSQIFGIYVLESVLLSVVAIGAGPPLGLYICEMLGSSNGFLEFVQRTRLPVVLTKKIYAYAAGGLVFALITMAIPAYLASRLTIVEYKASKTRVKSSFFWKRYFLDVIIILISLYGLYRYHSQQQILRITSAEGASLPMDPLLFGISVLFILGISMLFLRLFPYIVRMIFWFGKKVWSPVLYATFVQVGRSIGHEQFLMIFLILALSLGIYNSIAARTINRTLIDRIQYRTGADIVVDPFWAPAEVSMGPQTEGPSESSTVGTTLPEPPFSPYTEIAGIELATKVLEVNSVTAILPGNRVKVVDLMAVIPDEFGQVAWFRGDLLPYHWHNYLNLLAASPKACLLSTSLRERHDVQVGDAIMISWAGQYYIDMYVYGFVDYWPTFNPNSQEIGYPPPDLVVANHSYVDAKMALEPYKIWMRKVDGARSQTIFADMADKALPIQKLVDTSQQIILQKNDPILQGTNGALTLAFIVTMAICVVGFVIYWILYLKGRVLQFGILRAMGFGQGKVIGMLIWEQLLISGTAIILGIVIGHLTGMLFVPLLQLIYSAAEQVPPFRIVAIRQDFIKVYAVAIAILFLSAGIFRFIIAKIRIYQAIKLGEE